MYEILVTDRARKQLAKLERCDRLRVAAVLDRIRVRPFAHIKAIIGSPYYRARAGDYRIILDVQQQKLILMVLEVGHRRGIYK